MGNFEKLTYFIEKSGKKVYGFRNGVPERF